MRDAASGDEMFSVGGQAEEAYSRLSCLENVQNNPSATSLPEIVSLQAYYRVGNVYTQGCMRYQDGKRTLTAPKSFQEANWKKRGEKTKSVQQVVALAHCKSYERTSLKNFPIRFLKLSC